MNIIYYNISIYWNLLFYLKYNEKYKFNQTNERYYYSLVIA